MPQSAQIKPTPSAGATPQPRSVSTNTPANDSYPNTGPTQQPNPAKEKQKDGGAEEPEISTVSLGLMLGTAIFLDVLGILCVVLVVSAWVGWIIQIIGVLIFGLWFMIKGLPLMSPKSLANWLVNMFGGEAITAGFWPGFTIGILLTKSFMKIKEVTGVDVMKVASKIEGGLGKKALPVGGIASAVKSEGAAVATGATAASQSGKVAAPKNPVTASQEEHFADPSKPLAQGATPPPQKRPTTTHRQQTNPQDEQVATGIGGPQDTNEFSPDKYQEDPYALESKPGQRGVDALPKRRDSEGGSVVPFPGTSPQFGRGSRYEGRAAETGEKGGKILDFDIRRKTSSEEQEDTTPTGATPAPKPVNDDVS